MQKVKIKLIDRKAAKARQTKWRPLPEGLEITKTSINAKIDRFSFATARKEGRLQA